MFGKMRASVFQKLNSFSSLLLPDQEGADLQASADLANSIENPLSSNALFGISDTSRVE